MSIQSYLLHQPAFDRIYIESRQKIDQAESLLRRCITMLQSFSRAHSALLKEMDNRSTHTEFLDELYELNKQIVALR